MPIKSGDLGGGTLAAGIEQEGYICQAPAIAVGFSVAFCNKTLGPVKVRLAIGAGADSSAAGTIFLEYDATLPPGGVLERTGLAISVGKKVFVKSDTSGVDFAIYGFEK